MLFVSFLGSWDPFKWLDQSKLFHLHTSRRQKPLWLTFIKVIKIAATAVRAFVLRNLWSVTGQNVKIGYAQFLQKIAAATCGEQNTADFCLKLKNVTQKKRIMWSMIPGTWPLSPHHTQSFCANPEPCFSLIKHKCCVITTRLTMKCFFSYELQKKNPKKTFALLGPEEFFSTLSAPCSYFL